MIRHFSVFKFVALCRPSETTHLMTTNLLEDVNCEGCLEIIRDMTDQAVKQARESDG